MDEIRNDRHDLIAMDLTEQSDFSTIITDLKQKLKIAGVNTCDDSFDTLKTEIDNKNKQVKSMKKENQRLQSELKGRNETITSLIDQNFAELSALKVRHQDIIANIMSTYETNVKKLEKHFTIFKQSYDKKLKDHMDVHYKFTREKNILMSQNHQNLINEITALKDTLVQKNSAIEELKTRIGNIDMQSEIFATKEHEIQSQKEIMNAQIIEIKGLLDNAQKSIIQKDSKILELIDQNRDLSTNIETERKLSYQYLERIDFLEKEIDRVKATYGNIHDKYTLVLNDNTIKQNNLDEKILEVITLNSKVSELMRKITNTETSKNDLSVKVTETVNQLEKARLDLLESEKNNNKLKSEVDILYEEKQHLMSDLQIATNQLRSERESLLEKILKLQEEFQKSQEMLKNEHETKITTTIANHEKTIFEMRAEFGTVTNDKDKKIESLTNYVKSLTESQYITLNDNEKLKQINEKMQLDQINIDNRITEITQKHKNYVEDLQDSFSKEKETLLESFNESIKKSNDMVDALQTRLNQSYEALKLTKITITDLKETNQKLEEKNKTHDTEQADVYFRYNEMKIENEALREKLDRTIDLNTSLSNRERQHDNQLKQLRLKYQELLRIARINESMTEVS